MNRLLLWVATIFGFCSPLFANEQTDFRLATLPKSGTHILIKCLYFLGALPELSESQFGGVTLNQEQQEVYGWHLNAPHLGDVLHGESHKYIIMVRDVRDAILSLHRWMPHLFIKKARPDLYDLCIHSDGGDPDLQLLHLIEQDRTASGFDYLLRYHLAAAIYQKKEQYPHILFVKFEDLVGPNGGGCLEKQIQAIQEIAEFLKIPDVTEESSRTIAEKLWGGTETFNTSPTKGKINAWRDRYTPKHIQAIKTLWNDYLITFGYETTRDWN